MKAAYRQSEADRGVCDLSRLTVDFEPFPHVIHNQFIEPDIYRQLRKSFPICPPNPSPTGYSLYWGDDDYQRLLDTELAWRALFDTFHSQQFIELRATSITPDRSPNFALRSSDCLDLETSRAKLLGALEGASYITVIRNPGNIGDHLIQAGMRRLLKGIDCREVGLWKLDGERGEVAILSGSGAWCKAHQHLPPHLPQIENQFERVIIFPTSFDTTVEGVSEVLSRTRALVFAREFSSYEQIRHLCRSDVAHDTSFFVDFELYRHPGRGTLLAFRTDGEALTPAVPPGNRDVSVACESLDEFLWTIARHEVVMTDRAHVMIAAALLGKEVHFSAGNYHKVPALAASSLQNYPVSFEPDLREKLTSELETAGVEAQTESARDGEIHFPKSELEQLRDLADERGRLLDEILNSKSFRLVSFYWRLRRYLSRR